MEGVKKMWNLHFNKNCQQCFLYWSQFIYCSFGRCVLCFVYFVAEWSLSGPGSAMKINLNPRRQVCVGGWYGNGVFHKRLQSRDNILISQHYKGTFNKCLRITHIQKAHIWAPAKVFATWQQYNTRYLNFYW